MPIDTERDRHLPHAFQREVRDDGRRSAVCAVCGRHALDGIHSQPEGDRIIERQGPFGQ